MGVFYVPASGELVANRQIALYAKEEKNEKITSTFTGNQRTWRDFNRTTCMVTSSYKTTNLPDEDYDVCTPVLGPTFLKVNGVKFCLVNPHSQASHMCGSYRDAGIQTIADSGGFQIISGRTDFVDPVALAKSYNPCATLGMDLDLPPMTGITREQLVASAKIQMANREVLDAHVNKKVNMVTILHGRTYDDRQLWMDTVGMEDSKFISIAGLHRIKEKTNHPMEMMMLETLLMTVTRYKKTSYIHCLGCTNPTVYFLYSIMSHLGLCKNIGGDSVSHVLGTAAGTFFSLYPWRSVSIPKNFHTKVQPPCSCPICTTAQDFRILNGYIGKSHSLYCANAHKEYIVHLTDLLLDGEIKADEYVGLTNSQMSPYVVNQCIDYAREYKASGKFKPLKRSTKSLFNRKKNVSVPLNKEHVERTNHVIKVYEKYYQKGFL